MKLKIKQFGKIEEATIEVSGLSVITGNNDTGKSTVGKLLFSIIESISIFETYSKKKLLVAKSNFLNEFVFSTKILEYLRRNDKKEVLWKDVTELVDNFDREKNDVQSFFQSNPSDFETVILKIKEFNSIKKDYAKPEFKFNVTLDDILKAEFKKQFNKENSLIEVINGKTAISLIFDSVSQVKFQEQIDIDYLVNTFYSKVFFVEGAYVLENCKLFADDKNRTLIDYLTELKKTGEKKDDNYDFLSLHNKEMAKDLLSAMKKPLSLIDTDFCMKILKDINEMINGKFVYNDQEDSLKFVRNEKSFDISNIASGIKAFGILNILLKSNILNETGILVLDEPEANLHPIWQVKYAEFIVELISKKKINILINSHSPFFIDALKKASIKFQLWGADNVNFYHAIENKNNTTNIKNIKDLDEKETVIFDSFYKAYEAIDGIR
ncbi:MAG: ATP-binding protein [Elusimicrobiota bacterium]|jgi:predicted ATPase|nr:ATP-binding protein [Elusimicrobiota bacterium]